MKSKLYSFILLSTLFLFSCRTAKKMYEKGNYDEAVELAAKKLQKKPDDEKSLTVLREAYRFAVEDHEARIRNYSSSVNELRSEWIHNEYLALQRMYDAIRKAPGVFDIVLPTDYSSFIITYAQQAADIRFDRGMDLLQLQTKSSYKQAYAEFRQALNLQPGDLDIEQRMNEAYEGAVTNIVVTPLMQSGFQFSSYGYVHSFDNSMIRFLANNNRNFFVRYFSPVDASSRDLRVDQVVEFRFRQDNIDRWRDQRDTREVSKKVLVKEIVIRPDSVVKEYETVKARITTTRRTLNAQGFLEATVRDYNGQRLWSDTYRGDYNWMTEFASFTGDARALSEEDKKLIAKKDDYPPRYSEVMNVIMNEVQNRAECGVRDYFNRF